jgi:hypothetical protein
MNDHPRAVPISLGSGIASKTPNTNRDEAQPC